MKAFWKKYGIAVGILMAFVIYLLLQFRLVRMQFDDWGYASLSYAGLPGYREVSGGNFTIAQMLGFLKSQYMILGGRVVCFAQQLLAGRSGVTGLQVYQVLLLLGIFGAMFWMSQHQLNDRYPACTMLICILPYGLFSAVLMRDGMYWYSASYAYILPLCFLLWGLILYQRSLEDTGWQSSVKYIGAVIFCTIAAASMEQYAAATMVGVVLYSVLMFSMNQQLRTKQNGIRLLLMHICVIAGAVFILAAPGNYLRANTYERYYDKSLLERVIYSFEHIMGTLCNADTKWPVIYLMVFGIMMAEAAFRKEKSRLLKGISVLTIIMAGLTITAFLSGQLELLTSMETKWACWCFLTICLIVFFTVYFLAARGGKREYLTISLLFAGCASVGCLLVSPLFRPRHAFPFFLCWIAVIARCFVIAGKERKSASVKKTLAIVLMALVAVPNVYIIYQGWKTSNRVNLYNESLMIENNLETIQLMEVPDVLYRKVLWRDESTFYFREYFNLSDDTDITVIEYDETKLGKR